MRTNIIILVLSLLGAFSESLGQKIFYWSGNRKINLMADSTQTVLYLEANAKIENVKVLIQRIDSSNHSLNVPIRNKMTLLIKSHSGNMYKHLLSNSIKGVESAIPVYKLDDLSYYFTDEILLQPKKGIAIKKVIELIHHTAVVEDSTKYGTFVLKASLLKEVFSIANKIYESGLVDWCHPNFRVDLARTSYTPSDPLYLEQYYLNNTGQFGGSAGIDIKASDAWGITLGCSTVRVAVIDDGGEPHEDLSGRVLQGYTPLNNGNGAIVVECKNGERSGHGMGCAGIIAASHNSLGISGIAPNSQIIPINIFAGGETTIEEAAGINWAWDPLYGNADLISNSWTWDVSDGSSIANSDAVVQAITNARTLGRVRNGTARGCPVIFSSGNGGSNVLFPANVAGVITVGAIDKNGNLQGYSSRGPEMDLVAPSAGINGNQSYLGCQIPTGDIRTIDRMGTPGYTSGNYMNSFNGTSASAPQVSGVIALMLSSNPDLTETQIRLILQQTATDMGPAGFDNNFGYGRLNASAAILNVIGGPIAGPSMICASGTFSYPNPPSGQIVIWSSSNPNGLTINSVGVATRVNNFVGQVTISAAINGGCGPLVQSKMVWVGVPYFNTVTYDGTLTNSACDGGQTFVTGLHTLTALVSGATGYPTFTLNGPSTVHGTAAGNDFTFDVKRNDIFFDISYTKSNTCGTAYGCTFFSNSGGPEIVTQGDDELLSVYPNPVQNQITIVQKTGQISVTADAESFSAQLFDPQGRLSKSGESANGKLILDTSDLPKGMYYLHVLAGGEIIRKQILKDK